MKHPRKINWIIVVIVILVIIALFFTRNKISKPNTQVAGDTGTVNPVALPSPTELTFLAIKTLQPFVIPSLTPLPPDYPTHIAETQTAEPTMSPTATSTLAPPLCTFPLAQTTNIDSKPEKYSFSEPQVVLTDELQPDIVDWLPDNKNVLISRFKLIDLGMNGYRQTIELFDPETKEAKVYATHRRVDEAPPVWNPVLNAIIYPDMNVPEGSTITNFKFTRQVRISYGKPDDTQLLADNLPQYYLTEKPDGNQIVYLLDKELFRLDAALKPLAPVSFNRKRWDFLHQTYKEIVDFEMAWRPGSAEIFLYNHAIDGLGYTYILDVDTGRVCNLDFGGWALTARWSPNGRYLAIIRALGPVPIQSAGVVVLDTTTGDFYPLDVSESEIKGKPFVQDIAWAPDNHHLIFTLETNYSSTTSTYDGLLYLGDFISGQVDHILPSFQFEVNSGSTNLAWSPDGSKLLMNCPTSEGVKQVCLITVQTSGQ